MRLAMRTTPSSSQTEVCNRTSSASSSQRTTTVAGMSRSVTSTGASSARQPAASAISTHAAAGTTTLPAMRWSASHGTLAGSSGVRHSGSSASSRSPSSGWSPAVPHQSGSPFQCRSRCHG